MANHARIYVRISRATNERLERFANSSGITRSHLIEQALLHHLRALEELPTEAIVPPRVILDATSSEQVRDLTERPLAPTDARRWLFDDR